LALSAKCRAAARVSPGVNRGSDCGPLRVHLPHLGKWALLLAALASFGTLATPNLKFILCCSVAVAPCLLCSLPSGALFLRLLCAHSHYPLLLRNYALFAPRLFLSGFRAACRKCRWDRATERRGNVAIESSALCAVHTAHYCCAVSSVNIQPQPAYLQAMGQTLTSKPLPHPLIIG
jgi:hypothetical protein